MLMTSDVIDHIVTQTNQFANQLSSPLLGWETCTEERLKSFLGLVILMGINRLPTGSLILIVQSWYHLGHIGGIMHC